MVEGRPQRWSGRIGFVLATMGSAVGLGSIWKFPYEVGENGGGVFLVFYVVGLVLIVVPLMLAEFAIGRSGRADAATSIARTAQASGRSPAWKAIGLLGILTGFTILTYYAVIAGMTMAYVPVALTDQFGGADAVATRRIFEQLTGSPIALAAWQAGFLAICALIVARGIQSGVETACKVLMPLLIVMMLLLVVYAVIAGDVGRAASFIFAFDLDTLTPRTALEALGLGFFSIGVGMGLMITYAAYAGADFNLSQISIATIAGDTAISILAGLAIFPIVFAAGLDPAEGASLMFLTLPIAFAGLPFGDIVGAAFFVLLFVAALASAISLFEVVSAPLIQWTGRSRAAVVAGVAIMAWVGGLPTVLSFNMWAELRPLARIPAFADAGVFDIIDRLASNVLLPGCGLLVAVYAGWRLSPRILADELGGRWTGVLRVVLAFVVPLMIVAFVAGGVVVPG